MLARALRRAAAQVIGARPVAEGTRELLAFVRGKTEEAISPGTACRRGKRLRRSSLSALASRKSARSFHHARWDSRSTPADLESAKAAGRDTKTRASSLHRLARVVRCVRRPGSGRSVSSCRRRGTGDRPGDARPVRRRAGVAAVGMTPTSPRGSRASRRAKVESDCAPGLASRASGFLADPARTLSRGDRVGAHVDALQHAGAAPPLTRTRSRAASRKSASLLPAPGAPSRTDPRPPTDPPLERPFPGRRPARFRCRARAG